MMAISSRVFVIVCFPLVALAQNVPISSVTNLTEELSSRSRKGAGFRPGTIAVISASGNLESVVGPPEDCVRVDGTTRACAAESFSFIDAESPIGTINAVNKNFTLAQAPTPSTSLQFFWNGLLMKPGVDYTLSGNVITCYRPPELEDTLMAYYRVKPALTLTPMVSLVDNLSDPGGVVDRTLPPSSISTAASVQPVSNIATHLPAASSPVPVVSNAAPVSSIVRSIAGGDDGAGSVASTTQTKWSRFLKSVRSSRALNATARDLPNWLCDGTCEERSVAGKSEPN